MLRNLCLYGLALSLTVLCGCREMLDVSTPSQISLNQVRIEKTMATEKIDLMTPDRAALDRLARDYKENGSKSVNATVAYLADDTRAEADVRRRADGLQTMMRERGVSDINVSFVAVEDKEQSGLAVLTWETIAAMPPKDCGDTRIPGYYGAETLREARKYRVGCEVQSTFSKMVANPADLRGRAGLPDDSSRRHGAMVEGYASGRANAPLANSMSASTIGSGN